MPIIRFNAADALSTTVVPADIYRCEVSQITGPTKSSSGKSNNLFIDIMISEGKYKGKTQTIIFNSESTGASLMGTMQFFPLADLLQLDGAVTGREVKPEDYDMDTDMLLHKSFDASWGVTTVEGRMLNIINGFHPKGYASAAPAF